MGVRLIVEVLDHWQDAGLTAGERWDLLVLAENANDGTRLTFGPVHAQHILDRANKSPKGWKNAITALMRKKVITTHVPGRIKQVAVYHLESLCPDPPHDGYKGQCTRTPKDQKEGHPVGDPVTEEGHLSDDPMGHPADDPLGQEGHPADAERVIQQMTPTPPVSSFKESPRTTPSSSVAEDSATVTETVTNEEGGGGGEIDSSKDQQQDNHVARAESFVDSLDYRGKPPGQQRRARLCVRVAAAFRDGWSEHGLARYLDVSDDPNVRNPAAVYAHRLKEDELPDAGQAEAVAAGLPPMGPDCYHDPAAATDVSKRVDPISGEPCSECHPNAEQASRTVKLPPACSACLDFSPAAEFNVRLRTDHLSFHANSPCPRCHPSMVEGDWRWAGMDAADGGMWDRAMGRALARKGARADTHTADDYTSSSVDDLYGPRKPLTGTDAKVQGWYDIGRQLAAEEAAKAPQPQIARNGYQPYRDPIDQSRYDEDFFADDPGPSLADQSRYDKDL